MFFSIFYIALGIAVPAVVLAADHSNRNVGDSSIKLTAAEEFHGRMVFGQRCANCHTLAAAEAAGKVGPNLDVLKPPEELDLRRDRQKGRQRGGGTMPAGIYAGAEAEAVAAFVGATAGR